MDKRLKETIKAIRDGRGYDHIANHYWEFSRAELKDIILECLFVIESNKYAEENISELVEELEGRWFDYETIK